MSNMKSQKEIFALCDQVRETSFALHRYLRHGHFEKVYENGLAHRLRKAGLDVELQHPLEVLDEDGTILGDYFADLLVEKELIVELKDAELAMAPRDAKDAGDVHLRVRGEVGQKGKKIPRNFPRVLHDGPAPKIPNGQSGRLQLADWMVNDSNALLDRVIVNRIWHHLFGRGIVASVEAYRLVLNHFHTIWLRADPGEHMQRVIDQNDLRPMEGRPRAMDDLLSLLETRSADYGRASAVFDTAGTSVKEAVGALKRLVAEKFADI